MAQKNMINGATPLISLSAVVVDTETTGPDTKKDQIIQIGAVALEKGTLLKEQSYNQLVKPNRQIDPAATRVHGFKDDDLKDAPSFKQIKASFDQFIDGRLIIGHHITFDSTIMRHECERQGLIWQTPRLLCTRSITRAAQPLLPDYSLDNIARWLGIEVKDRHDAMGDALLTGQIFLALIPLLKEKGIHTLAQAEEASRRFSDAEIEQKLAGWDQMPGQTQQGVIANFDSYTYRHRIKDVMSHPPFIVDHETSVDDVLDEMIDGGHIFAFVGNRQAKRGDLIVTQKDILALLNEKKQAGFDVPIGEIANGPVEWIRPNAFLYRALGRVERLNINQLAVKNEKGELLGAITVRNLIRERAMDGLSLGDGIDSAETVADLGLVWSELSVVARQLLFEDLDVRDITTVISRELCALTRKCSELAEEQMLQEGKGAPPLNYAVQILGSAGRGESLLAMDQDNALILEDCADEAKLARAHMWFEDFGTKMNQMLHLIGVPLCTGGIMVKNKQWRRTQSEWEAKVHKWISTAKPEDILNSDIFFDGRPVHGALQMGDELWRRAVKMAGRSKGFLKLMAAHFHELKAPLNFWGKFVLENGRVDLKAGGLLPISSTARYLALKYEIYERSSKDRLTKAKGNKGVNDQDVQRLLSAHQVILKAILKQQLIDMDGGLAPSNKVEIKRLSKGERAELKEALQNIKVIDGLVEDPFAFG